MENGFETFLV